MSEAHELPAGPLRPKKSWGKENLGKWETHRLRKEMIRCFAARITRPVSAHENRFFPFFFFFFLFSFFLFQTSFSIWGTALYLFRLGILGLIFS
ncbi:hypothetical protein VN97_g2405 [Penicillium thymicola]|uniref:Uncharacterized protein n=1 Tax=Penicillium thymicola TaxID=293382 RepID=A0AAI9XC89_PENTH|nr:hypothetical protein VN97_g2405 [Penicillium thymicola]